jgi:phospho-N-acetylmuramoyl-pentapeptide-transferase
MLPDTIRILVPAAVTFLVGMGITPIVTYYLYKYKAWKKVAGKNDLNGAVAHEFNRLHADNECRAPRMGGIVVWGSVILATFGFAAAAALVSTFFTESLDFFSRSQTWVPLATLAVGALVGLIDDILVIRPGGEGVPLNVRLLLVIILSGLLGLWFFIKLDVHAIAIPFDGVLEVGWLIVPFFIALCLGIYASGVIDGIDGLSGGVFMAVFSAYAVIAFAQNQIDLAAFIASIVGGLLAFLWFNIPPARFYMSDTGTMALTLALAVVVFMTDSLGGGVGVAVFPVIGAVLVLTVASNVIQVLSKRWFGVKVFRVAPLHHHFEAIGWPGYKVTMRYWILSLVSAFLGVIIALSAL